MSASNADFSETCSLLQCVTFNGRKYTQTHLGGSV